MPESIIHDLLVDKKDVALEFAKDNKGFLKIDKSGYSPVLPFPMADLTLRDRILLELGTAYIAFAGGLLETSTVTRQKLSSRCKGTDSGIRGTLSKLRTADLIETTDEGDEITIEGFLELRRIVDKLKKDYKEKESET